MADTVDTLSLFTGTRRVVRRYTNVSDGTGESLVNKLDISGLTGPSGAAPTSVGIEEILYDIQGFTSIRIFFDHTTDDEAVVLSGSGYRDYTNVGGLLDPESAGGTGDILFTTAGAVSGGTYDISIVYRLKD